MGSEIRNNVGQTHLWTQMTKNGADFRTGLKRPLFVTPPVIRKIAKPIYDDPIKKIKHQMGYDVVPDRWEGGETPLSSSALISVQPMGLPSGTVFYLDFKPPPSPSHIDIGFSITKDGAVFDTTKTSPE